MSVIKINTGLPRTKLFHLGETIEAVPKEENTISDWSTLAQYAAVPIAVAALPIITLAALITAIYHKVRYNEGIDALIARNIVLRSLNFDEAELEEERNRIDTEGLGKMITIPSGNNLLDGIELIHPNNIGKPPGEQKWILYFNGSTGCYEKNIDDIVRMCHVTEANVLCVNYSGVGRSSGMVKNSNELFTDGMASLEYLLERGVNPMHVLLYGYSLGGGVAAFVAAHCPGVNILSDRSFRSLDAAIRSFPIPVINKIVAYVVSFYWNINSHENFKKIEGQKYFAVASQDFMIDFDDAALYTAYVRENLNAPTLSLNYDIDRENQSLLKRVTDYMNAHTYHLPTEELTALIEPYLDTNLEEDSWSDDEDLDEI